MLGVQPDRAKLLRHLAGRLADFGPLTEAGRAVVATLEGDVAFHARGVDLTAFAVEGPHIVLGGWACQMRPHATRRRQIFGFLLPGDAIGSFWRPAEFTFSRTVTLTPMQTLSAAHLMPAEDPVCSSVLAAARRVEDHAQHRLFDHIVRLGARDAYGGLAHLLLEFHARLNAVGLVEGDAFLLPVGQRVLAQAMGFSVAHTNHTLQRMTADGLLEARGERMRLLQPERLAAVADLAYEGAVLQGAVPPSRPADSPMELHPGGS